MIENYKYSTELFLDLCFIDSDLNSINYYSNLTI